MASTGPSPARLSSLSTSLLTSLVELSRLQSLSLPSPPSARQNVLKNLTSLRNGILALQEKERQAELGGAVGEGQKEILEGLRNQYGRLMALIQGMGMEEDVKGMELDVQQEAAGATEAPAVEDDEGEQTPRPRDPPTGDLIGSSSDAPYADQPPWRRSDDADRAVRIDVAGQSGRARGFSNDLPTREELREDEEDIRRQNADVQLMQKAMMDDQDRSLDALTLAITRQRDLSLHISSELETQEALLEDLDHGLDRTGSRLDRAGSRLDRFARKAKENGSMCTIVGLIVLLLILIILLK